MKKLLFIQDSPENKISYWHILFFLASMPFDRFYSEAILISFSVHVLLHIDKAGFQRLLNTQTIILQSVFIMTILGTLYSANKKQALDDAMRQLSIFLFPLLLNCAKIDISKYQKQLLITFSLVCTCTIAYLFLDAIHTIFYFKLPFLSLLSPAFDNHHFSQPIDIHATYFSMYVALSIVVLLQHFIETKGKKWQKLIFGICIGLLGMGLIQLSSRSTFFAIFIIMNIAYPLLLFKGNNKLRFMTASAICTLIFIISIYNVNYLKQRYIAEAKADLSSTKITEIQSDPRMERWKAALPIIINSPIIGHGSGSETALLKEQYFSKKMFSSYLNELNAHNQYISLLIKSGCLGLLVYLSVIFIGLKQALIKKDIIFLSFLILITTVSVSENILDVNKGIFFFSFFFSFFIFSVPKQLVAPEKYNPDLNLSFGNPS